MYMVPKVTYWYFLDMYLDMYQVLTRPVITNILCIRNEAIHFFLYPLFLFPQIGLPPSGLLESPLGTTRKLLRGAITTAKDF